MIPDLYSDDNGLRVIDRHVGPAGKGFPAGGTNGQILVKTADADYAAGWVNPPDGTNAPTFSGTAPADGDIVVFDGASGLAVKTSGTVFSDMATKAYADTKVTAVTGKGLSEEDFTTVFKAKLTALAPEGYRGTFDAIASGGGATNALADHTFTVAPVSGDYCIIAKSSVDIVLALWDSVNTKWSSVIPTSSALDGQDIADLIYNSVAAAAWANSTSEVFTSAQKGQLASLVSLADSLGLSTSLTGAYVAVSANYIVVAANKTVDCTANSFTVTLPTAVGQTNDIVVKNSGSGTITINCTGVQTIDGDTSAELTSQWESLTFRSTGTNWILI